MASGTFVSVHPMVACWPMLHGTCARSKRISFVVRMTPLKNDSKVSETHTIKFRNLAPSD